MFPKLIEIGGFFLPTYGALVATAFLVGLWVTVRLGKANGVSGEVLTNLAVYCALAGILGAKLAIFVFDFGYYREHPEEIFTMSTLQAGGVFQGGLVLAVLVAWWLMRRDKLPGLATADLFAPGIAIGHGIGRLGCFAAGCCWGAACDRPWAVTFTNPDANRLVGVPLGIPLHPSQLYESAAEFVIFAVLWRAIHRPHRQGSVIGLYLVLYSTVRFLVEFVRAHEQTLKFGLSNTQWISMMLCGVGIWLMARTARLQSA
ncbi:MAG: prolipoprotein diacylglyceryl transferase [Bryobacteraceae bacterium]